MGASDFDPGEPLAPAHTGVHIDGFTLLGVLGVGAMGVVHDAIQHSPRRAVAIKVMRLMVDAPQAERVRLEALAAARCSHPGIVKVLASGVLHGGGIDVPWIAMDRVEGATPVDRWFREHRPDREIALTMFERIADALAHAHARGVIHRDVKPGNILVDASGNPVVIDFGLAIAEDRSRLTEPGMLVGTMRTMAPEVFGGSCADTRSDIFSLAVCLHECLTGAWPFGTPPEHLGPMARAIEDGARGYDKGASRAVGGDLGWVLTKALDPDPARRHQTMDAFRQDLAAVRGSRPVSARPPSLRYRVRRWGRRNPATAALSVLLVVVVAASAWVSFRFAVETAAEFRRARQVFEIWGEFMARQPIHSWPVDVTLREMLDRLRAVHRFQRTWIPPNLDQLMRSLVLARAYMELELMDDALAMVADGRDIAANCPESGEMERFEFDMVALMIRAKIEPDGPELQAVADGLRERSREFNLWRRQEADSMLMCYASGPVTWECIEWAVQQNNLAFASGVAISLPRMCRFREGSPERILWASRRISQLLAQSWGPGDEIVVESLRKGAEGLRREGHAEAAAMLADALAKIEASDA